eukprot:jgi/Tetstr1/422232/TSEL_013084.t1
MESPRRSGLPLGERAEQVGMASALGELRSQMVLLLESNQALHTRLERIEAGLGTWGGFDDHAGWRVPEPREAPLDMRADPGANRKRASLWGRYEVAGGRATVDSAPSSAASSDGAVPTEHWMAEEEEAADGAAGWLAASPAHGAPSGDAAGPVCEGLEGGLQVDVPPTSTSFDSEHHSLHARFEGDKNSFGETSGYASKAFLGVSAAPSPHSGPASASPSLHTIRSERVQGGDNEGGDAGEVEESPEKDNFGPTTLMGRLKAAAALQSKNPKPRRRSLMDNPRESLAGYSVRDMQRNEYMRNHWRDQVPSTPLGVGMFFVRAILWGPYYPAAKNRMRWDFVMLYTACWACIYTPFVVCFGQEVARNNSLMLASEVFIQIIYTLDIYVNARTVFYGAHGVLVIEPWAMLKSYASSWLLLDLLAANPLGFMLPLLDSARWYYNILQVLQLTKLIKVIHVIQTPYVMKRIEETLGWSSAKLVLLTASAYALLHLSACVFFLTSRSYEDRDMGSWVTRSNLDDMEIWHTYIAALYWAMSTMTTVGYGDIVPQHTGERIWCMFGMLIGVTAFAYFMSSVASVAAAMNSHSNRMASQRAELDEFLTNAKIPKVLAEKVRRYRYYVMEREYGNHAYEIIQGLSNTLRVEVLLYLHSDILSKVPLFHDKSKQFMAYLVSFFKLEFYGPGDIIMEVDDRSDEMYFIGEGRLEVHVPRKPAARARTMRRRRGAAASQQSAAPPSPSPLANAREKVRYSMKKCVSIKEPEEEEEVFVRMGELVAGEFFGEYSCLTGSPRTATVTAMEYSELYSLSKHDLENMLTEWPEMSAELYSLMDEFVTGLPPPDDDEVGGRRKTVELTVFSVVKARKMANAAKSKHRRSKGKLQTQSTLSRVERAAAAGNEELDRMVARAVEVERDDRRKLSHKRSSAAKLLESIVGNLRRGNSEPAALQAHGPAGNWRALLASRVRVAPEGQANAPSSNGSTYFGPSNFMSGESELPAAVLVPPVGATDVQRSVGKTQFGL